MKKKHRKQADAAVARTAFVRGFVATGLLCAADQGGKPVTRAAMRRATKAGIAVAGGTLVADALQRGDYARSILTLAGSATCMAAANNLLTVADNQQEAMDNGQEKEEIT